MDATPIPTGATPPDSAVIVAADRWRLWSTLVRGLSHQLANASQMLTLSPPPPAALEEARERIAHATSALNVLRRPHSASPTLLAPVLDDVERLQRLQMDHPSTTIAMMLSPGVPALALRADEAAHLLLALVTAFKDSTGDRRAQITLTVHEDGLGARLEVREETTSPPPVPSAALVTLVASLHGRLEEGRDGALAVWLPAWQRPAPRA
jgi:hypothetical protein